MLKSITPQAQYNVRIAKEARGYAMRIRHDGLEARFLTLFVTKLCVTIVTPSPSSILGGVGWTGADATASCCSFSSPPLSRSKLIDPCLLPDGLEILVMRPPDANRWLPSTKLIRHSNHKPAMARDLIPVSIFMPRASTAPLCSKPSIWRGRENLILLSAVWQVLAGKYFAFICL